MSALSVTGLLASHQIQPSPQRLAVAEVVLLSESHPTADRVLAEARRNLPWLSRATVYNTLNLFVKAGLLRTLKLSDGPVVYDPNLESHHHFIDEQSGEIHDLPWNACRVELERLSGDLSDAEVREVQVILRGKRVR